MASDGIACRILIQSEQLQQVDTFLTAENIEKSQHTDFNEDTIVWTVAAYGCESWALRMQKHVLTPLR